MIPYNYKHKRGPPTRFRNETSPVLTPATRYLSPIQCATMAAPQPPHGAQPQAVPHACSSDMHAPPPYSPSQPYVGELVYPAYPDDPDGAFGARLRPASFDEQMEPEGDPREPGWRGRRRKTLNCNECIKRKTACDRRQPCRSCMKRGHAQCFFDTVDHQPKTVDPELEFTDLKKKYDKLKSKYDGLKVNYSDLKQDHDELRAEHAQLKALLSHISSLSQGPPAMPQAPAAAPAHAAQAYPEQPGHASVRSPERIPRATNAAAQSPPSPPHSPSQQSSAFSSPAPSRLNPVHSEYARFLPTPLSPSPRPLPPHTPPAPSRRALLSVAAITHPGAPGDDPMAAP